MLRRRNVFKHALIAQSAKEQLASSLKRERASEDGNINGVKKCSHSSVGRAAPS